MDSVSVVLVDDQPLVISGFRQFCCTPNGFRLAAVLNCTARVGEIVKNLTPNILIFDVANPLNRLEHLAPFLSDIKMVAFTASDNIRLAVKSLDFGVHGYILRQTGLDELAKALRAISTGEKYVTHSAANQLIAAVHAAAARNAAKQHVQFSAREGQILRLLLDGKTNKAIAGILAITENTVKHYMSILMQKLNARNRLEVVIAAQKLEQIAQITGTFGHLH